VSLKEVISVTRVPSLAQMRTRRSKEPVMIQLLSGSKVTW
jgi:hypothetical protein